jgi:hypothetical protein
MAINCVFACVLVLSHTSIPFLQRCRPVAEVETCKLHAHKIPQRYEGVIRTLPCSRYGIIRRHMIFQARTIKQLGRFCLFEIPSFSH